MSYNMAYRPDDNFWDCYPGALSLSQATTTHLHTRGCFKNVYELINVRAHKFSILNNNFLFQSMGKIFCVEFQKFPLKFHAKYVTHAWKDV